MIVLVTGASSGIGRETALACARRGDAVALAARNHDDLDQVAEECHALGAQAEVLPVDVTDRAAVDGVLDAARERFGRVDAVVHSAALLTYGAFEDVPPEVCDRVVDANLRGSMNVARSSLRVFRDQGGGHLVLVGSMLGDLAVPFMSPYIVSKYGVHGLARALQVEVQRAPGIEVSLVTPPGVPTPIYALAANYVGRIVQPPPPVTAAPKMASAIVGVLDRPRRKRRVGPVNTLAVAVSRVLPGLFDALVVPYFKITSLTRTPVTPHEGNVFATLPHRMGGGPERVDRSEE